MITFILSSTPVLENNAPIRLPVPELYPPFPKVPSVPCASYIIVLHVLLCRFLLFSRTTSVCIVVGFFFFVLFLRKQSNNEQRGDGWVLPGSSWVAGMENIRLRRSEIKQKAEITSLPPFLRLIMASHRLAFSVLFSHLWKHKQIIFKWTFSCVYRDSWDLQGVNVHVYNSWKELLSTIQGYCLVTIHIYFWIPNNH